MTQIYIVSPNTASECVSLKLAPNEAEGHIILHETFLSGIWREYENYTCAKSIIGKCDLRCGSCDLPTPFWKNDNLHNKSGAQVAEICFRTLQKLAEIDIFAADPDPQNPNWKSGRFVNIMGQLEKMQPRNCAKVFAYHVMELLKLGLRYNDEIFLCYRTTEYIYSN